MQFHSSYKCFYIRERGGGEERERERQRQRQRERDRERERDFGNKIQFKTVDILS